MAAPGGTAARLRSPTADAARRRAVEAAPRRRPEAFTEIVRRHRDHLWAVALRTTGDPEDAADALQDGLISAMRHAASFRGDAKLSTWLHRIVVNACLDKLRRRAAHPTSPLPDDDRAPSTGRDEFADRDTAADVQAALATLPADQRAAIVLVDIEGYPVAEAAAMLEVPAGTVKSRCARGRVKLVPLLAHLRGGQPRHQGNPPTAWARRTTDEPAPRGPPVSTPHPDQEALAELADSGETRLSLRRPPRSARTSPAVPSAPRISPRFVTCRPRFGRSRQSRCRPMSLPGSKPRSPPPQLAAQQSAAAATPQVGASADVVPSPGPPATSCVDRRAPASSRSEPRLPSS